MKLLILKEKFKEGLNYVERMAGKNLTLPILENVLISVEENFLNLTTTDLETAVSWWGLAKIEKKGKVAVPVRLLSNFTNLLPKDTIKLEAKNETIHIEGGNYKNQIKGFNSEDFPVIPKIENAIPLSFDIPPFIEGLSQVVDCASITTVRPEISGIYFHFQSDIIKIVATDSFRLAEKTLVPEKKYEKEYSFILPQKVARELINSFTEKTGQLFIYFSPNYIMFELLMTEVKHPQIQITSKLIEGEYPNYQDIVPKKHETRLILPKKDFLSQIKTAGLFSGKINEVKLKIEPIKNLIEIFSQSADVGKNHSSLTGKIEGKKIEVSFNWKFLIDGLYNIKTPEVVFELNGEDGPAALRPANDPSYLYIVMPIKGS